MLIPLALGIFVPSQPLGASAVNGDISMNAVGFNTATAYQKPPLERNILDWLREFNATSNPAVLNGQPVDVIGFVYREPGMAENQFMVARFTMSCCVADAFAIGMPVEYAEAARFTDGDWIRIQGTLQAGKFREDTAPIIQPTSVEPAELPDNAYLYS
jgi:putative membrane protein